MSYINGDKSLCCKYTESGGGVRSKRRPIVVLVFFVGHAEDGSILDCVKNKTFPRGYEGFAIL